MSAIDVLNEKLGEILEDIEECRSRIQRQRDEMEKHEAFLDVCDRHAEELRAAIRQLGGTPQEIDK